MVSAVLSGHSINWSDWSLPPIRSTDLIWSTSFLLALGGPMHVGAGRAFGLPISPIRVRPIHVPMGDARYMCLLESWAATLLSAFPSAVVAGSLLKPLPAPTPTSDRRPSSTAGTLVPQPPWQPGTARFYLIMTWSLFPSWRWWAPVLQSSILLRLLCFDLWSATLSLL